MPYDWEDAEQGGGGEKIAPGVHHVTGEKVVEGNGAKGPWVLLVVTNPEGAEASTVFTLTEKAGWKLAKWLSRCGVDLKAMKAEGIEPKHFANEAIADKWLVGRSCYARVSPGQNPKYAEVDPLTEEEAKAEAPQLFAGAPPTSPPPPCPVHKTGPCPSDCLDSIPF